MSSIIPKDDHLIDDEDIIEDQERPEEYGKGGYHLVRIGDTFDENRYRVVRKLGWGAFSTVWLCTDNKYSDYVAIKISKAKKMYRRTAQEEIKMLSHIKSADTSDPFAYRIVTFLNHFTFRGINGKHCCLVFEVMGQSLYKFQSTYFKKGIPPEVLKRILRQILEGLGYLHTKCRLIHTDIKPENILLTIDKKNVKRMHSEVENLIGVCGESQLPLSFVSMAEKEDKNMDSIKKEDKLFRRDSFDIFDENLSEISVKIADLGNASYIDDYNNTTIQTRPYRSPEVMLGSRFGFSADIWSTACMAFELGTGDILFDYENKGSYSSKNESQLARILELLGPLPKSCRKGKHYNKYFSKSGRLINYRLNDGWSLDKLLKEEYEWEPKLADCFTQFLLPMLQIDPRKRSTAYESLSNQWLCS